MADNQEVHRSQGMETPGNLATRVAGRVDSFFTAKYRRLGLFVGSRPASSIALSLVFAGICCTGFSQFNMETQAERLWLPQDTQAQEDEAAYTRFFPPRSRTEVLLLEARRGNALDKAFLAEAMRLHEKIEALSFQGQNLTSLCVPQPGDGHACFISSVLGAWNYDADQLAADTDHLATLNNVYSKDELARGLGDMEFGDDGNVTSAGAIRIVYLLRYAGFEDPFGEGWEGELLRLLRCNEVVCNNRGRCRCGFIAETFTVYPLAERSFLEEFESAVQDDVLYIGGAFTIMALYLTLNLGGICHKVQSRSLLAFACTCSIYVAGASGFGIAMWLQFDFTPIHGVLPLVLLGIGVDDAFVIMNALDHTDASLPVPDRIADAIAHAGNSIMVTSLTDFVAFAISVSSALPALSSFCIYAAISVLMIFVFQITFFSAFATYDTYRVLAGRIDSAPCLRRGYPCCPVVPPEDVLEMMQAGMKDPNQICCHSEAAGKDGGRFGVALQNLYAPLLLRKPVAVAIVLISLVWACLCAWQAAQLDVVDTYRNFIPDDSYVATFFERNDAMFGLQLGTEVFLLTQGGDYFSSQAALVDVAARVDALDYMQPAVPPYFRSWAQGFREACLSGILGDVTLDADGFVAVEQEYFAKLAEWLRGPGAEFQGDVAWLDGAEPARGIAAARFAAEFRPIFEQRGDLVAVDADRAVEVMDRIRRDAEGWDDLPSGGAVAYTREFLVWETFRIIKRELLLSVGLCLLAVMLITLLLIGHPLTSFLVFMAVMATVVDILGCIKLWGLAIDSITVVQLVISIGLCVDYAAHVGHDFMRQRGDRKERVTKTLGNVGAAVLNGGITAFLGVVLLAFSASYVFQVLFQTFFLTVVFGLFHGMATLPAVLSLIGPASYQVAAEMDADGSEVDRKDTGVVSV